MTPVARSISMASPNVLERNSTRLLSSENSARSPNPVSFRMCGGRFWSGGTTPAGAVGGGCWPPATMVHKTRGAPCIRTRERSCGELREVCDRHIMHRLDTTRYNALMTLARVVTVAGFLCAAMHLTSRAQSLAPSTGEFIAFRFDDTHVIAVVKSVDDRLARPKADRVISARPAAQYGFAYFDAPPELAAQVPATIQSARWVIHAAPGQVFEATAENVVAGAPGCSGAVEVPARRGPRTGAAVRARLRALLCGRSASARRLHR